MSLTSTVHVHIILQSCTQNWYNMPVRNISWWHYSWWKFGNLRILFDTLWSPNQQKGGNICYYYKTLLIKSHCYPSFRRMHCFWFDNSNKLCSFVALYRSPSQYQDDFEPFSDNFEMTLNLVSNKNQSFRVVLGDLNV